MMALLGRTKESLVSLVRELTAFAQGALHKVAIDIKHVIELMNN